MSTKVSNPLPASYISTSTGNMILEVRGDVIGKNFTEIANGDVFLGKDALKMGLVDRVISSDEYINERIGDGDRVLRLHKFDKVRHGMRFSPLDLFLKNDGLLKRFGSERSSHIVAKISSGVIPLVRVGGALTLVNFLTSFNLFRDNNVGMKI
jgi:ClpP class serine protease